MRHLFKRQHGYDTPTRSRRSLGDSGVARTFFTTIDAEQPAPKGKKETPGARPPLAWRAGAGPAADARGLSRSEGEGMRLAVRSAGGPSGPGARAGPGSRARGSQVAPIWPSTRPARNRAGSGTSSRPLRPRPPDLASRSTSGTGRTARHATSLVATALAEKLRSPWKGRISWYRMPSI